MARTDDLPADRITVYVVRGAQAPPQERYIEVINRNHGGSVRIPPFRVAAQPTTTLTI